MKVVETDAEPCHGARDRPAHAARIVYYSRAALCTADVMLVAPAVATAVLTVRTYPTDTTRCSRRGADHGPTRLYGTVQVHGTTIDVAHPLVGADGVGEMNMNLMKVNSYLWAKVRSQDTAHTRQQRTVNTQGVKDTATGTRTAVGAAGTGRRKMLEYDRFKIRTVYGAYHIRRHCVRCVRSDSTRLSRPSNIVNKAASPRFD